MYQVKYGKAFAKTACFDNGHKAIAFAKRMGGRCYYLERPTHDLALASGERVSLVTHKRDKASAGRGVFGTFACGMTSDVLTFKAPNYDGPSDGWEAQRIY